METQTVAMLQQMLSLTRAGKLRWIKTDYDQFEARAAGETFCVEFVFFARTDEMGSDRAMARLSAFRLLHDYCIGTQGFDLICEMLSLCDPEWTEWRERARKRLEEGMDFLRGLGGREDQSNPA